MSLSQVLADLEEASKTLATEAPREKSVVDVAHLNGASAGIQEAVDTIRMARQSGSIELVPEGMTAEKLRYIADYIQAADNIIVKMIEQMVATIEIDGEDKTDAWRELASGHAVQADLRKWADAIAPVED